VSGKPVTLVEAAGLVEDRVVLTFGEVDERQPNDAR